jgi:hypothetical protein
MLFNVRPGCRADKAISSVSKRFEHVKNAIGNDQLATFLQGTIRNLEGRAFKIGVFSGTIANTGSNLLESKSHE